MKSFGHFLKEYGCYEITELPKVGSYEYILKNEELLIKLDQFGLIMAQINPPIGEALVKREKRETSSPIQVYFETDGKIFHNFDVFHADKLNIVYRPHVASYTLLFGTLEVITDIMLVGESQRFLMNIRFVNHGNKNREVKILSCCYPYVNELLMAPWDKPEWYTKTQYDLQEGVFVTTRYSVDGDLNKRRFFTMTANQQFDSYELSSERLLAACRGFTQLPDAIGGETEAVLYAFEQCFAGLKKIILRPEGTFGLVQCFAMASTQEDIPETVALSRDFFCKDRIHAELEIQSHRYQQLFEINRVQTRDDSFNHFVNGFLPLELHWVSALDRGWPTGMRGVRDASNDFQGLLSYDKELCRAVIVNIFSKQRSDGWYPRQVPFGAGTNFDLRAFVDSACFFTEYVYDYLAYTNDFSILDEEYGYYDSSLVENGLAHLMKGLAYLMQPENLGEHGLVKLQGGDWLDCLGGAGKNGIGETVMVSCQLVMSIRYVAQILEFIGKQVPEEYDCVSQKLQNQINGCAFNEDGFYNGVFTDRREWILSDKDPDGEKRVYVPTNAYAIISGIAKGKEAAIIENIKSLRTPDGYKLFSEPFGRRLIAGIGKMGTGDFQPYFAENASVYNHGSQAFLLRALAKMGEHELFGDVLGFALPIYEDRHAPDKTCAAPYAITNCYHLVPSFYGRAGFSFLTGSVAMIERAVYQWMYGISYTFSSMMITPCVPKAYADSVVMFSYGGSRVKIKYHGFGAQIRKAVMNHEGLSVFADGRSVAIDKKQMNGAMVIEIYLF